MHLAPPSRRALGLTAVGAIAMSTTVFTLGGVASALPSGVIGADGTVPADTCGVTFEIAGGAGGDSTGFAGGDGDSLEITLAVEAGAVYDFTSELVLGGAGGTGAGDGGDGVALRWNGDLVAVAAGGGGAGVGADGGADGFWGDDVLDPDADPGTDDGYYGGSEGSASLPGAGGEAGADAAGAAGADATSTDGGAGAPGAGGGGGGGFSGGGGAGATDASTGAGGGAGYTLWPDYDAFPVVDVVAGTNAGSASAAYSWVACPPLAVPSAPELGDVVAGDGSAVVQVWPAEQDPADTSALTYEYRVDGGSWKPFSTAPVWQGADLREGTVPALTNGTTHSIQVRALSDAGAGAASVAKTVTPFAPIGAPGGVAVTTTPTSVRVTWTAPTVPGTYDVAGYVIGMGTGEMGGEVCETAADVLSCTVTGVQSGVDYSVVVFAVDTEGNAGEGSEPVQTGAIPFPSSVPTANGPLTTSGISTGSVTPGSTITVSGTGYAPFSTVTVLVYSTPTVLGTAQADANGAFTFTGKLPAGLAAGSHTLVAAGVDGAGNPRYLTQAITVGGAAGSGASGGLAYTGADIAVPTIGGLAALAVGGGLVLAGRRRRSAE